MLKFWRSPKPASNQDRSPSPHPPSNARPHPAPPATHLHGLDLGLPPALGSTRGHVSVQSHGEHGARERASSAQDASTSPRSTRAATSTHDDCDSEARLHTNGILRERNGDPVRTVSAGSTSSTSAVPPKPTHLDRSLSPASLSPSLGHSLGTRHNGGVASIDFADRDPTQIYAPTTWSEMAHQELVNNLSPRERTRQEILWEVVASEERYVAELRSLVNLYATKLLHTLAPSPSLAPSPRFGFSPELGAQPHPHAHAHPSASTSSASLPIASRFARTPTPEPEAPAQRDDEHGHERTVRIVDVLDMEGAHSAAAMRRGGSSGATSSTPHLVPASASSRRHASSSTLGGPRAASSAASSGSSPNLSVSSRIASAFRSSRHSSRTAPSSATSTSSSPSAPSAPEAPLALPVELRDVLEACVEMLRGHDELSARLKEQWARAFPLVRGLAAIWSDQPWFLGTYTTYVLSLEPALASLDRLLPSSLPHSHASSSSTTSSSSAPHKLSSADKRLAHALRDLELEAADLGESGLGICLSKPLMRLGKLPLLMQALLYHTDPTTHEWEKTRAMALEVDALVRSIEDEKVEEEERERTRDALARIDGVKDKTLMAPRAARILISEHPAPLLSQSAGPSTTTSGSTRAKFARRMSAATSSVGGGGKKGGKGAEWLVSFTDVVVRAVKTGETSIPGSFSREKEKRGKQGAPRKAGKTRNTYRFVRIERWEPPEFAAQKLEELNERRRTGRAPASDDEELEDEDEDGFDVESRMSFRYDADSPQPLLAPPRSFLSPSKHSKRAPSPSSMSPSLAQPSSAKFGTRLRAETPVPHPHHHSHPVSRSPHPHTQPLRATTPLPSSRFDAPTVSSQAKVHGSPPLGPPPSSLPAKPREAATESSSSSSNGLAHARDQSSFALYQMWAGAQDED